MTNRAKRIEAQLRKDFSPETLIVVDESHLHAGHAGASTEGETHFFVEIQAEAFTGQSRVAAHRLVNDALKAEFDSGLHALRLKVTG